MPAATADELPPDMTIVDEVLSWNGTSNRTLQSHVIDVDASVEFRGRVVLSPTPPHFTSGAGVCRRTKGEDEVLFCVVAARPLVTKREPRIETPSGRSRDLPLRGRVD